MNQVSRNRLAVTMLVILYVFSWFMSLGSLFGVHFWDAKYAREHELSIDPADFHNTTTFGDISATYYSQRRFLYFLPHVLGAVVWWNLYFLQLVPSVRKWRGYQLHRILGRVLMVAALLQVLTGLGLAVTSHSNIITLVSWLLAVAVLYCLVKAWQHAVRKEISYHKYWVLRMVGYLQTIALQRLWLFTLIFSHEVGWYGLFPDLDSLPTRQAANAVVYGMFDDSFVLAIVTAILGTEWYLAGLQGMLEVNEEKATPSTTTQQVVANETSSLLPPP